MNVGFVDGEGGGNGQEPDALEDDGNRYRRARDDDGRRRQEAGDAVGLERTAVVGMDEGLVDERAREAGDGEERDRDESTPTDNGPGPHTSIKLVHESVDIKCRAEWRTTTNTR